MTTPVFSELGLWLASSSLAIVAAWVATKALRKASAATRHAIWLAAFVALLAFPAARWLLPKTSIVVAHTRPVEATPKVPPAKSEPHAAPMQNLGDSQQFSDAQDDLVIVSGRSSAAERALTAARAAAVMAASRCTRTDIRRQKPASNASRHELNLLLSANASLTKKLKGRAEADFRDAPSLKRLMADTLNAPTPRTLQAQRELSGHLHALSDWLGDEFPSIGMSSPGEAKTLIQWLESAGHADPRASSAKGLTIRADALDSTAATQAPANMRPRGLTITAAVAGCQDPTSGRSSKTLKELYRRQDPTKSDRRALVLKLTSDIDRQMADFQRIKSRQEQRERSFRDALREQLLKLRRPDSRRSAEQLQRALGALDRADKALQGRGAKTRQKEIEKARKTLEEVERQLESASGKG